MSPVRFYIMSMKYTHTYTQKRVEQKIKTIDYKKIYQVNVLDEKL